MLTIQPKRNLSHPRSEVLMSHLHRAARRAASSIAIGGLLAAPAMAGAAGTQPVDVTAQLQCGDALQNEPASMRISGTVPASTRQGEFLDSSNLTLTVQHARGTATAHGPAPHFYFGNRNDAWVDLSGGEGGTLSVSGFPRETTALGNGRFEARSTEGTWSPVFVGGTAPVKLALTRATVSFTIANDLLMLTGPVPGPTSSQCKVVGAASVPLATIANAGAAPAGAPKVSVSSATEANGISSREGGLLYLRGSNLKGVRTIQFGPHRVRVTLNSGSTIYAVVPPLEEFGTWPVTVSRADGTSSAIDEDVTVSIYQDRPES